MTKQKHNLLGLLILTQAAFACGNSDSVSGAACSDWVDTSETIPLDAEWTGQAEMGADVTENTMISFETVGPIRKPTSGPSSCSDDRFVPLRWRIVVEGQLAVEVVEDVFWDTRFEWISSDGANRSSESIDVVDEGFSAWPSNCFEDAEVETDLYVEFSEPSFLEAKVAWVQASGCETATMTIESGEKPF